MESWKPSLIVNNLSFPLLFLLLFLLHSSLLLLHLLLLLLLRTSLTFKKAYWNRSYKRFTTISSTTFASLASFVAPRALSASSAVPIKSFSRSAQTSSFARDAPMSFIDSASAAAKELVVDATSSRSGGRGGLPLRLSKMMFYRIPWIKK